MLFSGSLVPLFHTVGGGEKLKPLGGYVQYHPSLEIEEGSMYLRRFRRKFYQINSCCLYTP